MGMPETATSPAPTAGARLGERLRTLRVSAGLTQTQLAGERFSKEYISQIERGKTRPTESTISWLAEQLGVDPVFLASGVSTEERTKVEAQLEHAEALSASHRYDEAVEAFREAAPGARQTGAAGARAPRARGRGVGAPGARSDARGTRPPRRGS